MSGMDNWTDADFEKEFKNHDFSKNAEKRFMAMKDRVAELERENAELRAKIEAKK